MTLGEWFVHECIWMCRWAVLVKAVVYGIPRSRISVFEGVGTNWDCLCSRGAPGSPGWVCTREEKSGILNEWVDSLTGPLNLATWVVQVFHRWGDFCFLHLRIQCSFISFRERCRIFIFYFLSAESHCGAGVLLLCASVLQGLPFNTSSLVCHIGYVFYTFLLFTNPDCYRNHAVIDIS